MLGIIIRFLWKMWGLIINAIFMMAKYLMFLFYRIDYLTGLIADNSWSLLMIFVSLPVYRLLFWFSSRSLMIFYIFIMMLLYVMVLAVVELSQWALVSSQESFRWILSTFTIWLLVNHCLFSRVHRIIQIFLYWT